MEKQIKNLDQNMIHVDITYYKEPVIICFVFLHFTPKIYITRLRSKVFSLEKIVFECVIPA